MTRRTKLPREQQDRQEQTQPKVNQQQPSELLALRTLASTLVSRATLAAQLGKSYGGDRDVYTALGYPKVPQFEDYWARYDRQDIATRVVEAYPAACWRKKPVITESEKDQTKFEEDIINIFKENKVWHYLKRIDMLSGIGRYGVLMFGFDDVTDRLGLREPVENANELLYLRPVMENNVQISTWNKEPTSPRYGMPEVYKLTTQQAGETTNEVFEVHHSRVLHIAENIVEGEVYGTPRLKNILNRLQDLELVSGGSAEMFWRGAFPGYNWKADAEADLDSQTITDMQDQIEEYVHGLKRYVRTQGITAESLAQQVADPSKHAELLIKLISAATGIPTRILTGSERGELASSQDESNWNDRVDERRQDYCEPFILRAFIDKLIAVGIITEPEKGYTVIWADLDIPSDKEAAETAKVKTEALATYNNSPGLQMLMPPTVFYKLVMKIAEEEILQIEKIIGQGLDDDLEEEEITEPIPGKGEE